MRIQVKKWLIVSPLFVFLLPVFFTLHGYTEYYNLIPAKDAFRLLFFYHLLAAGLLLPGYLLYRNLLKAAFLSYFLLATEFFYGAFTDFIRQSFPGSFPGRNSFLLPALLLLLTGLIVYLRKTTKTLHRLSLFLTTSCLLLIVMDLAILVWKINKQRPAEQQQVVDFTPCTDCATPDIYLLIADGYPGQSSLTDNFGFDNTGFITALRERRFHVTDSSRSNYNFTPYSVSSMLNMHYLEGIQGVNSNLEDMRICYQTIKNASALQLLEARGYALYNYSIFDFTRQPSLTKASFLPAKTSLITAQTFSYRIMHEIGFHLVTTLNISYFTRKIRETDLVNNTLLIRKTLETARGKTAGPKFVYTHLVMPHYPYYYDSSGNRNNFRMLTDDFIRNKEAFISYLRYTNQTLLSLVDQIRQSSPQPPVILLMSDHGFREFRDSVAAPYHFANLNAVFRPDSNYTGHYSGQSNINQFRIFFNTQFGQHFPLLKDSSSLLRD